MEDNAPSAEEKAPSTEARSVGASPVRAGCDDPRDRKQPPAEHFTSTLDVVNPRDERQAAECDYEWEGGDVAATLSQSAVNVSHVQSSPFAHNLVPFAFAGSLLGVAAACQSRGRVSPSRSKGR